ncbi:hypothetical protein P7L74_08840 [Tistrella mobilis]|uniref:lipopolysaccharide biosynthesis protein n=1 Tax=Tistrella mobilis TaxID=171437 RepID=UPI0035582E7A
MSAKRARIQRFLFFTVGTLLQKGGQFLLLPLLIGTMSAAEFARYGQFTAAVLILVPLFSLNVHVASGRLFFDYRTKAEQARLMNTTLLWGLVLTAAFVGPVGMLLILADISDPLTLGSHELIWMVAAAVLTTVVVQFYSLVFRLVDRPPLFAMVSASLGFGLLIAYTAIEPWFSDKLMAAVVAYIATNILTAAVAMTFGRRHLSGGGLMKGVFAQSISYASGTMTQNVMTWVNNQSGRWVGAMIMPVSALAGYTLVSYVTMAASMVAVVLFETMRIDIMGSHARGDHARTRRIVNRTMYLSLIITAMVYLVVLAVQAFQDDLLPLGYHVDRNLVLAAAAFSALQVIFFRPMWLAACFKRTKSLATVMVAAGIVTLAASWYLGQLHGAEGLMLGAVIGSAFQVVAGYVLVSRLMRPSDAGPVPAVERDGSQV